MAKANKVGGLFIHNDAAYKSGQKLLLRTEESGGKVAIDIFLGFVASRDDILSAMEHALALYDASVPAEEKPKKAKAKKAKSAAVKSRKKGGKAKAKNPLRKVAKRCLKMAKKGDFQGAKMLARENGLKYHGGRGGNGAVIADWRKHADS